MVKDPAQDPALDSSFEDEFTTGQSEAVLRPDAPRQLSHYTVDDLASLIGSAIASLAFVWVCYEKILAFSGIVGFIAMWWAVFLICYAGVSLLGNPVPAVTDRLAQAVVTSGAAIIGGALAWVVVYTLIQGWPAMHHLNFYTQNMTGVAPTAPLNKGGIWFAIIGTAEQVGIATAISLPLGVGTAVFLSEVGGNAARIVRTVVEAMTALPDILAGLFIYTVLIFGLGWERDGLAVALALSVTMTPIVARSAEVVLRVVPGGLREAAWALGASQWQTVWRVVLPTARSGLATSLILGIARVAGESAPLLIVSGATTFWNKNPLHQPQMSLPLFIYTSIRSGQKNAIHRGWGAAALLLILVLALFVAARIMSRDKVRTRPQIALPRRRRTRKTASRAAGGSLVPMSPVVPTSPIRSPIPELPPNAPGRPDASVPPNE